MIKDVVLCRGHSLSLSVVLAEECRLAVPRVRAEGGLEASHCRASHAVARAKSGEIHPGTESSWEEILPPFAGACRCHAGKHDRQQFLSMSWENSSRSAAPELSPRTVGLPESDRPRRVAGLRREEVAQLAHISTDYYMRLEQGRMQASAPVLDIAGAGCCIWTTTSEAISSSSRAGPPSVRGRRGRQKVQPQLQRVLDDLTVTPAIVQGRRGDVLAWNALAAALVIDFSRIPEKHRNYPADPVHRAGHAHLCTPTGTPRRRSPWRSCGWRPRSIPRTPG
ncbi:hypothetical protein SALBM311S_05720 [Streptomyces alboniger]